jgi:hypothetical protein
MANRTPRVRGKTICSIGEYQLLLAICTFVISGVNRRGVPRPIGTLSY